MLSTLPEQLGLTAIVLGAGATRGSTLAGDGERPLPPLDADFFTQVQRIKHDKHQPYVDSLIQFCHSEFGPGWSLSMEKFFNHVWYAQKFRSGIDVRVSDGGTTRAIAVTVVFRQVLLATLEQALFGEHSHSCLTATCELHDALAQHLQADDGVISFNYDCLIDASLRSHCAYWDVDRSYGFKPLATKARAYWESPAGRPSRIPVNLYKLHGSINWQAVGTSGIRLVQRPYTRQKGDRDFFIVPPVLSKDDVMGQILWPVWQRAFRRLVRSESIVVAGYSLPAADPIAQALFTSRGASEKAKPLKYLILANPDRQTRHHLIHAFRASIGPRTRVLVFDKLVNALDFLIKGSHPLH